MSKPLHKDPSFWIVAVVALGFAIAGQLSLAVPWFKEKLLAMRPAPRTPVSAVQSGNPFRIESQPDLDNSKKTYPWQRPQPDSLMLQNLPQQVVIVPTEYSPPSGGWTMSRPNLAIGIRMPAQAVVMAAYQWSSWSRMVLPDVMPDGQYDYVANLPSGAFAALQKEVTTKLGLVAERETRPMDALFLKVHHTNAPDLKPVEASPLPREPGMITFRTIQHLASFLESMAQMPVIDETGLSGTYDIRLAQSMLLRRPPGTDGDGLEQIKKGLLDRLGLELVKTNAPVEVLVVKRVNPL